jgi:hypothetical protein
LLPRLFLGALAMAISGALILALWTQTPAAARSARDLAGERWHRLSLHDQHIGYLHSVSGRNNRGGWWFETDMRFVLQPGQPVRVRQRLQFDPWPPFALVAAEQWSERAGALTDGSLLRRSASGYQWRRGAQDAHDGDWHDADLQFNLADYLAFETWLRETAPAPGATTTLTSLDLGRQQLVPKRYRVLEHNADGFLIENPVPNEATLIQLDGRMRPLRMTLAGLFELERVTKTAALAPRTALQAASYYVPVDRPLADHTRIRRLTLGVEGSLPAATVWPSLTDSTGTLIELTTNPLSGLPLQGDELIETAEHPVSDPRIRAMALAATLGAREPLERISALTRHVHQFISYQDDRPHRHVLALLDDPVGDCNEYADLLTTLARSLGIPSRTVFGLAYADQTPPAFRFHAWNELMVGDEWIVVDPTWNQIDVDATHIPMPLDAATALQLLTGSGDLRFVVRSVDY